MFLLKFINTDLSLFTKEKASNTPGHLQKKKQFLLQLIFLRTWRIMNIILVYFIKIKLFLTL